MQLDSKTLRNSLSADLLDVFIRIGLLAFLVILCARVVSPFVNLALWSVVLAVALYPVHQMLASKLGGKQGRAATVLVLLGVLLIGVPTAMLGGSFAKHVHGAYEKFESGSLTLPEPKPSVEDWPIVGERVYAAWGAAADNLPEFVEDNREQLKQLSRRALGAAASTASAVGLFIGSLIVAGIIMAYGASGTASMQNIIGRVAGTNRGPQIQGLITATVRSVATGVIGVAFIQALILGIGFLWAGIPAAGVLALLVMVLGIMQAPALLITLPVIGYLWSAGDATTTMNLVYTVYLFVGGLADNVLKPLLLGRGVEAPMPVILLGALGGMVTGGIVGLFIGAVLLAVGYQLFMDWVAHAKDPEAEDTPVAE
jgi:predicted PurR-regulated permease PerM